MPKLSDEEMQAIRDKLAARRKARSKKPMVDPLQQEVLANLTHYEVHVFEDRLGTRRHSEHATLEAAREARAALGRNARALIYAAGRLPSRGPEATGIFPIGDGEY